LAFVDSQVEASLKSLGHLLEGKMKQTTATTVLSGRPAVEQRVFDLTELLRREDTPQRVLQQRGKGLQREV
jgi:hypothetical protein